MSMSASVTPGGNQPSRLMTISYMVDVVRDQQLVEAFGDLAIHDFVNMQLGVFERLRTTIFDECPSIGSGAKSNTSASCVSVSSNNMVASKL